MVKPDFFDSESVGSVPPEARLLFIGLWLVADDYGNLKFAPSTLRKALFGFDNMRTEQLQALLLQLEAVDCIRFYEVADELYIEIPNFSVYQSINRPSKTSIPPAKKGCYVSISEDSVSAHSKERKKERKKSARGGSADAPPATPEEIERILAGLEVGNAS